MLFSLIGANVYVSWPVLAVLAAILGMGMLCGALNGVLVGYLAAAGLPHDARQPR